jgi:hypothetical protein
MHPVSSAASTHRATASWPKAPPAFSTRHWLPKPTRARAGLELLSYDIIHHAIILARLKVRDALAIVYTSKTMHWIHAPGVWRFILSLPSMGWLFPIESPNRLATPDPLAEFWYISDARRAGEAFATWLPCLMDAQSQPPRQLLLHPAFPFGPFMAACNASNSMRSRQRLYAISGHLHYTWQRYRSSGASPDRWDIDVFTADSAHLAKLRADAVLVQALDPEHDTDTE